MTEFLANNENLEMLISEQKEGLTITTICKYCDEPIVKFITIPVMKVSLKKGKIVLKCETCKNILNCIITKEFEKYFSKYLNKKD